MSEPLLAAVLDRLLPRVDELAGAGGLGLAPAVAADRLLEGMPDALERVLGALPARFGELSGEERDAALAAAEAGEPEAFRLVVTVAYNAYYLDPRVRARIERLTGYRAGAPQPGGYELEPFDAELLTTIAAREPFWRRT